MKLEDIHNRINSIVPIEGISIGVREDASTWKIFFKDAPNDLLIEKAYGELLSLRLDTHQESIDREKALAFLAASDIKIIRRKEEIDLGVSPFLSESEYMELLQERQRRRALLAT